MLFAYLLGKWISIVAIIEPTLIQKVDAEDEHSGGDIVRQILYMLYFDLS